MFISYSYNSLLFSYKMSILFYFNFLQHFNEYLNNNLKNKYKWVQKVKRIRISLTFKFISFSFFLKIS